MKYITVLVDGMADYEIESLGNKTPLQVANIPNITNLAQKGEIGLVQTVPKGMSPGSDTANLSVMGYAPEIYHTGRSPLEAASMGVELLETDVTFRCNVVTLSEDEPYDEKTMIDHSAGEISSEESKELILFLKKELENEFIKYYPGVSYRHLIVWDNGPLEFTLIPPHDFLGQKVTSYLPQGPNSGILYDMMKKSFDLLNNHPINISRKEKGLNPANSIWIWGEGKKPKLDSFNEKFGLKGSVISAVDLIYGIGILAGLKAIPVEGATGTIHTNFDGKATAAIKAILDGDDFVYIHLEAPDECGHQGDLDGKIKSIEIIDEKIVKPVQNAMEKAGEAYRILILPDHRTPIKIRTHSSEPVPYVIYDSTLDSFKEENRFSEMAAENSGKFFSAGHELLNYFLQK
ncbi:cofactor-independent phosphoglycerate mutase [Clostridium grantii]|uniref:2,3-bisphosphoglycerate-independent phosphoglycerate mutase n=1 Tax=Clostridium grantii DSM 8605 TaxID=1121316 RepID=A0A1M5WHE4_9CLOT|nr:cofactor-independent phosphoglycerate mutase [Clostridium grantii]SHH86922.1 2,3-bisphosphoglycerate-independent phosphoglycerate mutase [Clostridium grantii DSM 8605]